MNLKDYASTRKTRGKYKVPKSVQQSIPVEKIYEDGIWKSGDVYSMMCGISDISHAMISDERKKEIQNLYGAIYTAIPTDCWAKFSIISQRMDDQMFRRDILMHRGNDGKDDLRAEYNRLVSNGTANVGNVLEHKYLIVSTNKKGIKDARDKLHHAQSKLIGSLSSLGCIVRQMNNNDRLQVLHNFFRAGEEGHFRFDLSECKRLGHDFRDYVAPTPSPLKRTTLKSTIALQNLWA